MSKRGKVSEVEKAAILENRNMDVVLLAKKLGRTVKQVKEVLRHYNSTLGKKVLKPAKPQVDNADVIRGELRNSLEWQRLKDEFDLNERKLFEEKYVSLMSQFKGDVLPTEETQIFLSIKFDILMSRNLIARKKAIEDIVRLETDQSNFLRKFNGDVNNMSDNDKQFSMNLENQLQQLRVAEQSRTTEYVKLHEQHSNLMKSMKSTRDQRIKQIESSKINFFSIVKMLQEREIQKSEGRQAGLMRLAAEKEYNRLGKLHKFDDGNIDRPILSAETVDLEEDADA